jgi:lipopolysaccharide/colanic/teichoic acid biosynthesis glycosyltransferase
MFISLVYGLLFLSATTYFFKQFGFSRAVVLITYAICFTAFLFWRVALKIIFRVGIAADTRKSRTLIVGNENRVEEVASKLKSNVVKLYQVIGYIGLTRRTIGEKIGSHKFLGTTENIKKIIEEERIEKVIFSSDDLPFNQMFSVVSQCQGLNVEFLVVGKEMDYLVGKSSMTMLDDMSLLKVNYNVSTLSSRITKRLFDLIAGVLTLFLVYPFIYLFQKFASRKGSFTQFVLGVPQVCVGSKSFIGPRTSSYHDGLYVGKVGLTGFWFIENLTQADTDEMKKMDIFYARNQNFWLDLEILGKTFSKMFFRTE